MAGRNDRRLSFDSVKERDADFSGRKLDAFHAIASRFEKCCFEKMSIRDACFGSGLYDSEYYDCSFDGSKFTAVAPGNARFVRCSFRDVLIRQLFCHCVEFVNCKFSGKLLSGYFNGAVPPEDVPILGRHINEFRGNDFIQMELVDVGFRSGIDLSLQRLPSGPEYIYIPNAEEAVRELRKQMVEWSDLELRREAMVIVQVLELELEGGQKQLFLRTKDLISKVPRKVADKVVSSLQSFETNQRASYC